jgi:flavin-dependent dehydrogenase
MKTPAIKKSEPLGEADVIIIGGGPAGSSTALHLERLCPELSQRTLLLERAHHPREKICGGALTLNAESIMDELGITFDIPSAPVHHVQLVFGAARLDLPEDGCAKRIVRRCELDSMLFRAVRERGIRTIQDLRVARVVRYPSYLLVHTSQGHYRAKVVVSADGVNAVLRRTPGFNRGKLSRIFAIETPADPAREPVFRNQVLLVDLSYVREGLEGYYWDFPCYIDGKPYVSRGIVAASKFGNNRYLHEVLARRGVSLAGALRKAWPIRHFNPRDRFSQPRMLLVGDALGSDPLFSEGISQALGGGKLAAEAIVDAFQRDDLSFSRYRQRVLQSRLGSELRAYELASRLLYGRHAEVLLSMLHQSEELRNLIGHSYAGTANIHEHLPKLSGMLVRHLFHYTRNMSNFRTAANRQDLADERVLVNSA